MSRQLLDGLPCRDNSPHEGSGQHFIPSNALVNDQILKWMPVCSLLTTVFKINVCTYPYNPVPYLLTSCIMISFCSSWVSRPLACTTSRFCHRLSERALFLSWSCNTGGDTTPDPSTTVPAETWGERFSSCRRCSISCCLDVSRYSWYRKAGETNDWVRRQVTIGLDYHSK